MNSWGRVVVLLALFISLVGCIKPETTLPEQVVANTYARPEDGSKFLEINGIKFHYRDQGKGETILALHGVADSLHTFEAWSKIMVKNNFRVIRFDLPGFGLSSPLPDGDYRPETILKAINDFIEAKELNSFHMVGNSLGGLLSWMYSLEYPYRVKSLSLIDPAGYPFKLPWIIRLAKDPLLSAAAQIYTPKVLIEKTVKEVFGNSKNVSQNEIDRFYAMYIKEGNKESYLEIFRAVDEYAQSLSDLIPKIAHPTIVLWGEQDRWIPAEHHQRWLKDVPMAQGKIFAGLGHVPQLEDPQQTAREILHFLKSEKFTDLSNQVTKNSIQENNQLQL